MRLFMNTPTAILRLLTILYLFGLRVTAQEFGSSITRPKPQQSFSITRVPSNSQRGFPIARVTSNPQNTFPITYVPSITQRGLPIARVTSVTQNTFPVTRVTSRAQSTLSGAVARRTSTPELSFPLIDGPENPQHRRLIFNTKVAVQPDAGPKTKPKGDGRAKPVARRKAKPAKGRQGGKPVADRGHRTETRTSNPTLGPKLNKVIRFSRERD